MFATMEGITPITVNINLQELIEEAENSLQNHVVTTSQPTTTAHPSYHPFTLGAAPASSNESAPSPSDPASTAEPKVNPPSASAFDLLKQKFSQGVSKSKYAVDNGSYSSSRDNSYHRRPSIAQRQYSSSHKIDRKLSVGASSTSNNSIHSGDQGNRNNNAISSSFNSCQDGGSQQAGWNSFNDETKTDPLSTPDAIPPAATVAANQVSTPDKQSSIAAIPSATTFEEEQQPQVQSALQTVNEWMDSNAIHPHQNENTTWREETANWSPDEQQQAQPSEGAFHNENFHLGDLISFSSPEKPFTDPNETDFIHKEDNQHSSSSTGASWVVLSKDSVRDVSQQDQESVGKAAVISSWETFSATETPEQEQATVSLWNDYIRLYSATASNDSSSTKKQIEADTKASLEAPITDSKAPTVKEPLILIDDTQHADTATASAAINNNYFSGLESCTWDATTIGEPAALSTAASTCQIAPQADSVQDDRTVLDVNSASIKYTINELKDIGDNSTVLPDYAYVNTLIKKELRFYGQRRDSQQSTTSSTHTRSNSVSDSFNNRTRRGNESSAASLPPAAGFSTAGPSSSFSSKPTRQPNNPGADWEEHSFETGNLLVRTCHHVCKECLEIQEREKDKRKRLLD